MRNWEAWVRGYLDLPRMAGQRDERIVGELAAHLEETWREARARGASEAEADALVRARLGDRRRAIAELLHAERHHAAAETARRLERAEEALRERGGRWMPLADLVREIRSGLRALGARPAFTAVVVLVLALGIGAATAIFTLLDAIVLSPLPFPHADRVVTLSHDAPNVGRGNVGSCAAWHFTYEDENRVFESLGLFTPSGSVTVVSRGEPEAVPAMGATSGVFRALGVQAVAGRVLTPADEDPEAPAIALLGYGYWRSRFGGDAAVVGTSIEVNGGAAEIVGVLPASFRALGQNPALVFPLRFRRSTLFVGNVGYRAVARLEDGVTLEQAEADMARMLPLAFEKFPGGPVAAAARQAHYVPHARWLKNDLVGRTASLLWVLMAGVGLVLVIACANVANLMLVRAEGREREMAIRTAMGAGRRRIGWEYLKESVLVGLLGGAAGTGLAYAGLRGLLALAPSELPRLDEVALDTRVLLFALSVSLASGVAFGMLPMLRRGGRDVVEALKQGGRSASAGRGRRWGRRALAVGQVSLALVVLVAAGLVVRSAHALRTVDPGFTHAGDVLALRLSIPRRVVPETADAALVQEAIARRLGEIAGVTSVGMATDLPMHAGGNINPLYVDGVTVPGKTPPITRRHKWIGQGYFETLGIPLLAGRSFTWADVHNRIPAVVVSASLARAYWGSVEGALDGRVAIRPDPPRWYKVIGVAGDVREDGLGDEPVPMVYWPQVTLAVWQGDAPDDMMLWRSVSYAVRSARVGTPGFLDAVRSAVRAVNPNLPLQNVGPLSSFVAESVARTSFTLLLLTLAAVVALVLGLVGVYGVIAYDMSQRTQELGVRLALGATGRRVQAMVLAQGLSIAGAGVAVGVALALAVTRLMQSQLFGVTPTDPATFAAVAAGVTLAAAAASYLPARKASQVDPLTALRSE